jgi:hypothetical protein
VKEYYLRIDHLTQNRYSGDPETNVDPNSIDSEKNLHVYLTGEISPERSVSLRARKVTLLKHSDNFPNGGSSVGPKTYKASLQHYTLSAGSRYLLKAIDDDQDPWVMTSYEIRTK